MIDQRKCRRWWRSWWFVSLGACTAWPALASEREVLESSSEGRTPVTAPAQATQGDVESAALVPTRRRLALARLPQSREGSPGSRWLAQGARPGENLALVLRVPGHSGWDQVLASGQADGAGRAKWVLPEDRGLREYSLELWSLGTSGLLWSGPLAQVLAGGTQSSGGEWSGGLVPQQVGGMIVSEIMKDPSAVSDTAGEWLELYNPLWMRQNIEGWTLSDDGGASTILTNGGAGIWVAGRGHRALVRRLDSATNGGVTEAYAYSGFTLSNGADEVILAHPDGTVVDRVAYDDGVLWPDTSGASLQLDVGVESPRDNDSPSRWCVGLQTYGAGDTGTPGAVNDDC